MIQRVACAVIKFGEKILVVQRGEQMKLPLKWEFPGGKIEPHETAKECIEREVKEELNIEISLLGELTATFFDYSHLSVELIPFLAEYLNGEIELKEHKQFKFLKKEELLNLDWAEADISIVNELQLL